MLDLDEALNAEDVAGASWTVQIVTSSGESWSLDADRVLKTASVAKLFLLTELAAQIADGRIDENELLSRASVRPVHDSGMWQYFSIEKLPVTDVARLVGAVSDNWATNVLLKRIGLEAVSARSSSIAAGGSRLLDFVRDERTPDMPGTLSVGCASDWVRYFEQLRAGELLSPAVSGLVRDWLASCMDFSMVAGAFNLDPLSHGGGMDRGVSLLSKTGTDEGVRADVGLVSRGDSWVSYAVICNWTPEDRDIRDGVLRVMRAIGQGLRGILSESG